ncbi:MAG: class I SAM-dependent methyltransferase [Candidatus Bathyarchaeota archaeon]|nr:class I SAM-dependent methyltransferase [Candidatus Bathyarchaeum sp.]
MMNESKQYYKKISPTIWQNWVESHSEIFSRHLEALSRCMEGLKAKFAIDIGCGYGRLIPFLSDKAEELVEVDVSTKSLKNTREITSKFRHKTFFVAGDANSLSFLDGSFQLVVCYEVFIHIENSGMALSEMRRVMADNGVLILSTTIFRNRFSRLLCRIFLPLLGYKRYSGGYKGKNKPFMKWFTKNEFLNLLSSHKFSLRVKTFESATLHPALFSSIIVECRKSGVNRIGSD